MRTRLLLMALLILAPGLALAEEDDQFVEYLKPLYASLRVGMEYKEAIGEVEKARNIARVKITRYQYQDLVIVLWQGENIFGDGRPEVWVRVHFAQRLVTCIVYVHSVNGIVRESYRSGEKCPDIPSQVPLVD